jgi:glycerol-3-phosphate acyltransferase PlsY
VGATNAMRVLGKGPGVLVLLLDMLKGFFAVVFLGNLVSVNTSAVAGEALRLALGFVCICGHNWTVFLRFKGGKGVATTLGVLAGLAVEIGILRLVLGLVILTWLVVFFSVGIVSVASLACAISLPIYMLFFRSSGMLIIAGVILSAFIILRHRNNIRRLLKGEEPKVKLRAG